MQKALLEMHPFEWTSECGSPAFITTHLHLVDALQASISLACPELSRLFCHWMGVAVGEDGASESDLHRVLVASCCMQPLQYCRWLPRDFSFQSFFEAREDNPWLRHLNERDHLHLINPSEPRDHRRDEQFVSFLLLMRLIIDAPHNAPTGAGADGADGADDADGAGAGDVGACHLTHQLIGQLANAIYEAKDASLACHVARGKRVYWQEMQDDALPYVKGALALARSQLASIRVRVGDAADASADAALICSLKGGLHTARVLDVLHSNRLIAEAAIKLEMTPAKGAPVLAGEQRAGTTRGPVSVLREEVSCEWHARPTGFQKRAGADEIDFGACWQLQIGEARGIPSISIDLVETSQSLRNQLVALQIEMAQSLQHAFTLTTSIAALAQPLARASCVHVRWPLDIPVERLELAIADTAGQEPFSASWSFASRDGDFWSVPRQYIKSLLSYRRMADAVMAHPINEGSGATLKQLCALACCAMHAGLHATTTCPEERAVWTEIAAALSAAQQRERPRLLTQLRRVTQQLPTEVNVPMLLTLMRDTRLACAQPLVIPGKSSKREGLSGFTEMLLPPDQWGGREPRANWLSDEGLAKFEPGHTFHLSPPDLDVEPARFITRMEDGLYAEESAARTFLSRCLLEQSYHRGTVRVKTLTGKTVLVAIEPADTTLTLKEKIQDKEGIPPNQQRIIFSGAQIHEREKLVDHGIVRGSVIRLVLRLRGTVSDSPRHYAPCAIADQLLQSAGSSDVGSALTPAEVAAVLASAGPAVGLSHAAASNGPAIVHVRQLLTPFQCSRLMALTDGAQLALVGNGTASPADFADFRLEVSRDELSLAIGADALSAIISRCFGHLEPPFPNDSPPRFVLRRRAAPSAVSDGASDSRLAFHRDAARATAMLSLNPDNEYVGSRLLMLTSGRVLCPTRAAGDALVIDDSVVHGVTRLRAGVRYNLFAFYERSTPHDDAIEHAHYGFPFILGPHAALLSEGLE